MSEAPPYTHTQLLAKVEGIIKALSNEETVSAAASLDALAFVAAVIYDMDPTVTVPSRLRLAAEQHGGTVFAYLKYLRKHFESTGQHFGEAIGGSVQIDPSLMPEITKGLTKQ